MSSKKWLTVGFVGITVVTVVAFWTISVVVYIGANETQESSDLAEASGPIGIVKIHGWIQLVGDPENYEISSSDVAAEIELLANNPNIEVIVLDIHSSGGSTSGADEIIGAIKRIEKPVIAMIREQAMSSAYLIASAADSIYADRYAVVGGLGITGSYLSNAGKHKKEGTEFIEISSGPHKDMWNRDREMKPVEKAIEQGIVDEHFEIYLQTVAEGRGMDINQLREVADGRPYTAKQAKTLGLIDYIGGVDEITNVVMAPI